jgi:hypothetical protein
MSRHVVTQYIGGRWFLAEDMPGGRQWTVHNFATAAEALEFGRAQGWRPRLEVAGEAIDDLERRLLVALGAMPDGVGTLAQVAAAAKTSVAAARRALSRREFLASLEEAPPRPLGGARPIGEAIVTARLGALTIAAALRPVAAAQVTA